MPAFLALSTSNCSRPCEFRNCSIRFLFIGFWRSSKPCQSSKTVIVVVRIGWLVLSNSWALMMASGLFLKRSMRNEVSRIILATPGVYVIIFVLILHACFLCVVQFDQLLVH